MGIDEFVLNFPPSQGFDGSGHDRGYTTPMNIPGPVGVLEQRLDDYEFRRLRCVAEACPPLEEQNIIVKRGREPEDAGVFVAGAARAADSHLDRNEDTSRSDFYKDIPLLESVLAGIFAAYLKDGIIILPVKAGDAACGGVVQPARFAPFNPFSLGAGSRDGRRAGWTIGDDSEL